MILALLPLAVLIAVVALIVEARGHPDADTPGDDPGIGTLRRLFIYVLALVGLIFGAVGVSMVIGGAFDAAAGNIIVSERRESLSVALAFTTVGIPAWLFFAALAQRSARDHPVERRSQARRLYLGLARGIALAIVASSALDAGRMLLAVEEFRGAPWGQIIAWSAVWLLHQRLAAAEPPPSVVTRFIDRFTAYFSAVLGLGILLAGVQSLVHAPLSETYDRAFRETLARTDWTVGLREAAVSAVVGAGLWSWFWLRDLVRHDRHTTLWRVMVFLFGALLGVTLVIVPAGFVLYQTLEWLFGQPGADEAAAQFSSVPTSLSVLVVGVALWVYHRAVLTEAGAEAGHSGPERVYRYVLAGAGLVASAIGLASFIALAADTLGSAGQEFVHLRGWWRNPLVRAITLLVVGAPVWVRYWAGSQREILSGRDDRSAPSRRVFLFATVGIAVLVLLVSLTVLLYEVFQAALSADVGMRLLRDSRWAIAAAGTSAVVGVYYLLILREDQAALGARPPAATTVSVRDLVVLASEEDSDVVDALMGVEGARVRVWHRLDGAGPLSPERRDALLTAVSTSPHVRLLVIVSANDFEVVPYRGA